MLGAIRAADHLLRTAKMEIVMARVADWPTAIAGFQVRNGLLGDFLAHGLTHLPDAYPATSRGYFRLDDVSIIWTTSLCVAT